MLLTNATDFPSQFFAKLYANCTPISGLGYLIDQVQLEEQKAKIHTEMGEEIKTYTEQPSVEDRTKNTRRAK